MSNLIVSYIRQGMTLLIGGAIAWANVNWQWLPVDDIDSVAVAGAMSAVVIGVYYAIVRGLAEKFPQVGFLFGVNSKPLYEASNEDF